MRREDTPEEAAFRAEARAFLEANAELRSDEPAGPLDHSPAAEAAAWEKMKAWQRKKYDGGWAAITWPTEYGGRGGTPVQSMIFNEEQSKFDVPVGFIAASLGMIGPALMRFGTDDQKKYLNAMLRGDEETVARWAARGARPGWTGFAADTVLMASTPSGAALSMS